MEVFEWTLALLVVAVGLTTLARRLRVPYPSLLALAGVGLAFLPHAPEFRLDPELTLALFVAPVLLDAAFDTSVRDLKRSWFPVTCLVFAAVGVTTAAVAWLAHTMVPDMPWSAAIALGAIVAPPDAAAASAVLRQLKLPHRVLVILEGESLLNDATALLIYRLAVMAFAASGELSAGEIAPTFALSVVGSIVVGYGIARVYVVLMGRLEDQSSAIVMQFAGTFGMWILAERLGLSAIVTVVVYAMTVARDAPSITPARQRVPSYAVWETAVFVLNVLAFVLIGLQLRPIVSALEPAQRIEYLLIGAAVLGVVVLTRLGWILIYYCGTHVKARLFGPGRWVGTALPTAKGSVIAGWCGMRGIVTLAAAYALPDGFAYRDLILLCAFCVVVGTLVLQGFTLRPLILLLDLRDDGEVDAEARQAHKRLTHVAVQLLDGDSSPESDLLRREFAALLEGTATAEHDSKHHSPYVALRARIIAEQRRVLLEMRAKAEIGDDAFHLIEERLDWAEMSVSGR